MSTFPRTGSLVLCLGLIGCATTLDESVVEIPLEAIEVAGQPAVTSETALRPRPEDYPAAPFEGDSLYQLLVAEIAGYRSHYDIALEKYMQEAESTRDPGVVARAANMALYLKKETSALEMVKIWSEVEPDNMTLIAMQLTYFLERIAPRKPSYIWNR